MPPQLSTYQKAANAIYQPQQEAEQIALQSTEQQTINTLEAEKPQIQTDYQSAIDKLTQSVQDQSAQIAQLYSQRLGGNFSGLQGNDMGAMFARANEAQATIEETRANKLAQITSGEANAKIAYSSGMAALAPKYQSLETQYAQSAYGQAVKDFQSNQLAEERLAISASRAASSSSNASSKAAADLQKQYNVKQGSKGQYMFTGPNGVPISMAAFAQGAGLGSGDVLSMLQNGTSYDKNVYSKVKNLSGDALAKALSSYKVYGF